MTTAILGTGIIGLSTAYYLSLSSDPSSIHLVDPTPTLFASASGYAGGFLARDWFSPALSALGELSFAEHKKLAEEFGGRERWGYAPSTSVSYSTGRRREGEKRGDDWLRQGSSRAESVSGKKVGAGQGPSWLRRVEGDSIEVISGEGSTAQVDPLRLCQFLLEACLARGVQLHHPAKAIAIGKDTRDEISTVRILNTETEAESDFPCTRILIAAGVWSPQVFATLFPESQLKLPISSLAGHSLVVRSPRWSKKLEGMGTHALFTTDPSGYAPELFSRAGGEIYIAGINDSSIPVPKLATESNINESLIKQLETTANRLLGSEEDTDDLEIVRKGLCFRPVTNKGFPILARIPDEHLGGPGTRAGEGGLWLAAGHGPWGIANSLGTGKVMAEMIQWRPTSADVSGLGL